MSEHLAIYRMTVKVRDAADAGSSRTSAASQLCATRVSSQIASL
jgi:hypothetical protein